MLKRWSEELRNRTYRRAFIVAASVFAIVGLTAAIVISWSLNRALLDQERRELALEVNANGDALSTAIHNELEEIELLAKAVGFEAGQHSDFLGPDFDALVARLMENSPAVHLVAASRGYVISRIYPLEGNEKALGLDYRTVPAQLPAIEHVMRTGQSILDGPVDLVQGGTMFILRSPIRMEGYDGSGDRVQGVVSTVIDRDALVQHGTKGLAADEFRFALREVDDADTPGDLLWGDGSIFDQEHVTKQIEVPGGSWQLGLVPAGGWPVAWKHARATSVLTALICLVVFLAVFGLWSLYQSRKVAERQLKAAIESINDGFAMYDPDDRLVFANEHYRSYYALSRDAMYPGNSFENILRYGLERGQYQDAIGREEEWLKERLADHRNPGGPIEQKLANGRWLQIAESRTEDGFTVGFRVDVTEVVHAREAAEAANRAKSEFLNVVSHELRTPLTSILGYAGFVQNMELLPEFKKLNETIASEQPKDQQLAALDATSSAIRSMAQRISKSGDQLLTLINDILDRSKLDAQKIELDPSDVDVRTLVESVTSSLELQAEEKGIELSSAVDRLHVEADEFRMTQVLLNVVGNAIKFTDQGSVRITAESDADTVRIFVTDTGCGIAAEDQERIFDEFVQVDSSATRKNAGTGLGLAISRQILRLHGGDLMVSSNLGEGSVFTIIVPRRAQHVDLVA